jgi:hypothetical protein
MPKEISKISFYRPRAALPSLPAWTPGLDPAKYACRRNQIGVPQA